MMRTIFINYEHPPIGGGAASVTANLARGLAARGNDVLVVTARFRDLPIRERRDGYEVLRLPAIRTRPDRCTPSEMLSFIAGGFLPLVREARRWKPDVTCAFFGMPCGPLALALRQLLGIPYIVALQGGDVPGFLGQELALLHRLALPAILEVWQRSAGLYANSPALADLARTSWRDAPVEFIPNGVDTHRFQPVDRQRTTGPLRLLFIGRLAGQKGLKYLLPALAKAEASTRLRIVGDGRERANLQEMTARLGLTDRVEFVGWSSREDVPKHYDWADAFVLPSIDEGMPIVVLEAMAAGLPIIATDVSGSRDLVQCGVNGWLVPPGDPAALSAAITDASRNAKGRWAFGRQSRERSLSYRWTEIAGRYEHALAAAMLTRRVSAVADARLRLS